MEFRPRRTAHRVAVGMAVLLSGASVALELGMGICAQTFFDPLPTPLYTAAYLFLAAMLALNESVLAQADRRIGERVWEQRQSLPLPPEKRTPLELARIGTGAALAVAAVYAVMFLPIMPISAIGVLVWGMGLCGLSPFINLSLLLAQSRALGHRWRLLELGTPLRPQAAATCAALAVICVLVGRPLLVGYHIEQALANPGRREQAVQRLRWMAAESEVLRLCYETRSPLLESAGRSLWTAGVDRENLPDVNDEARKLYYLLTGKPFETADASRLTRTRMWARFDDPVVNQQGGELVGRAVKGLSLSSSRLDGVVDPRTETAYSEWTLVFRNATSVPQEARAEILLPEGGVVDRVSLWISGEERPAAFGPRDVVRQAYQEVAVVQQRDPLLVTAKDAGHVLAQCFPVPASGEMKIRLGMTAPLVWADPRNPRLTYALPSFQHVNFTLPADATHQVWLEGHWRERYGRLAREAGAEWQLLTGPAPAGQPADERTHTARMKLPADQLFQRHSLAVAGGAPPAPGDALGNGLVRRTSPFPRATRPVDLLVLLSPTLDMRNAVTPAHREALRRALAELPSGSHVRFVDVREAVLPGSRRGTSWLDVSQVEEADRWWESRDYHGGAEPARALEWAWDEALGRTHPTAVLWLHGPTPEEFKDAEQLVANYRRRPEGPVLVGVRFRPGPDALMRELAGNPRIFARGDGDQPESLAAAVRLAAAALDTSEGLKGYAEGVTTVPLGGREPALNGTYVVGGARSGAVPVAGAPGRVARLAANSHVLAPWYAGRREGREIQAAQTLAISRRLVTPMSGAVVLETQEQYRRHNLSDAAPQSTIPSVPEPGTVALLLVGTVVALAAAYRGRRRSAGAG